jgi:hypothetical protein
MRVARLDIQGFRGIKRGRVTLGTHTVLLGPNNCGKTAVLDALALVLGRDRLVRTLTEHDFHGSDPGPTDRIQIIATLTGFTPNDAGQHPEWFRAGRAVPQWYDVAGDAIHAEPDNPSWELCARIGYAARFDRESLGAETVRFFLDDVEYEDPLLEEGLVSVPNTILAEVGFFLVPAARTWDRMMSFGSELFRRVVTTVGGLPAAAVRDERDRLRSPQNPLEDDEKLRNIVDRANEELARLFARNPRLRLRITGTDSEAVLDAVTPHYEMEGGPTLPAKRHGTGLVSLQVLLLLLEFGRSRSEAGKGFCLGVEEPELHVPPALQRHLVHRLQSLCTQTIATSHSPLVASFYKPTSTLFIENQAGELRVTPLLRKPLAADASNALRRLFLVNRQETLAALMHECVLVPEGFYDFSWFRLFVKAAETTEDWGAAEGENLFGTLVGVVPTSDSAVASTYESLSPVHPRIVPLVDGDDAGKGYLADLHALASPPPFAVRWPDGWAVENVVGWLLAADASTTVPRVSGALERTFQSADDVAAVLRTETKEGGLKGDPITNDIVTDIIAATPACVGRLRELLGGLSKVCTTGAEAKPLFEPDPDLSSATQSVFVFRPCP